MGVRPRRPLAAVLGAEAGRSLRGDFVDPVSRLVDAAGDLFGGDQFGSGLHLVWALVFLALLVVVARRLPASYTALHRGHPARGLSAENLDSFERYAMGAFPLLLGLALVTGRRDGGAARA